MCMGLIGCEQEAGFKDCRGMDRAKIMQDEKMNLQQGPGVDGNLHLCIKPPRTFRREELLPSSLMWDQ
jgi:hypothetical protein